MILSWYNYNGQVYKLMLTLVFFNSLFNVIVYPPYSWQKQIFPSPSLPKMRLSYIHPFLLLSFYTIHLQNTTHNFKKRVFHIFFPGNHTLQRIIIWSTRYAVFSISFLTLCCSRYIVKSTVIFSENNSVSIIFMEDPTELPVS